ncbi:MAG: hypothetical protein QXF76_01580, partial [Candidatus Anstonellales archaeon]
MELQTTNKGTVKNNITKLNFKTKNLKPLLESLVTLGTSKIILQNSLHGRMLENELLTLIAVNKNKIIEIAKTNGNKQLVLEIVETILDKKDKLLLLYERKLKDTGELESLYLCKPSQNVAIKLSISIDQ